MLSFPIFAGPLMKQKNHFPARAAHIILPACPSGRACLLPDLLSTAASKGQHQHPDLFLGTFCPPQCSEELENLFLTALCTVGISLSINTSEVYLTFCLLVLNSAVARGRHYIRFTVQQLNSIIIFTRIQKLTTVGFPKSAKQAAD